MIDGSNTRAALLRRRSALRIERSGLRVAKTAVAAQLAEVGAALDLLDASKADAQPGTSDYVMRPDWQARWGLRFIEIRIGRRALQRFKIGRHSAVSARAVDELIKAEATTGPVRPRKSATSAAANDDANDNYARTCARLARGGR